MSNLKKYLGKVLKVKIDRPLWTRHPEYGFIYPINYWYIPNTISWDWQEIDAYILGIYNPVNEFEWKCIAIIKRLNDNEDKLIIAPENFSFTNQQIISLTEFQEKFFDIKLIR